jgi:hypothetical protein
LLVFEAHDRAHTGKVMLGKGDGRGKGVLHRPSRRCTLRRVTAADERAHGIRPPARALCLGHVGQQQRRAGRGALSRERTRVAHERGEDKGAAATKAAPPGAATAA